MSMMDKNMSLNIVLTIFLVILFLIYKYWNLPSFHSELYSILGVNPEDAACFFNCESDIDCLQRCMENKVAKN